MPVCSETYCRRCILLEEELNSATCSWTASITKLMTFKFSKTIFHQMFMNNSPCHCTYFVPVLYLCLLWCASNKGSCKLQAINMPSFNISRCFPYCLFSYMYVCLYVIYILYIYVYIYIYHIYICIYMYIFYMYIYNMYI